MDRLRFISLASGSSGNCYYIGTALYGILIDAGIGVRTIRKRLKEAGVPFEHVRAVFVTHDHADHIRAVGSLGEKYHIPVYSTQTILDGINRCYAVTEKLYNSRNPIRIASPVDIHDFQIEAFPVSHDASESVGYTITYKEKRFTIATDLGYIGNEVAVHIRQANYLVIESNYDEQMLREGSYPNYLKKRVASQTGHMANHETALFLSENYHSNLNYIYLCHLSKENNTPEKAYSAVSDKFLENGIQIGKEVEIIALSRMTPSELFIFE